MPREVLVVAPAVERVKAGAARQGPDLDLVAKPPQALDQALDPGECPAALKRVLRRRGEEGD
jgi:hypothetical protein